MLISYKFYFHLSVFPLGGFIKWFSFFPLTSIYSIPRFTEIFKISNPSQFHQPPIWLKVGKKKKFCSKGRSSSFFLIKYVCKSILPLKKKEYVILVSLSKAYFYLLYMNDLYNYCDEWHKFAPPCIRYLPIERFFYK